MSSNIITLSHGAGGHQTQRLIQELILTRLGNPWLNPLDDAAVLPFPEKQQAVLTTDSYVVDPIFFPGGSIGTLAAAGTINDLLMQAAEPLYLTLSLILEEGLEIAHLRAILDDFCAVFADTRVKVVTGDTKVVERGHGSKIFINTAGLGVLRLPHAPGIQKAQPGDVVLLTGTIAEHGVAILNARHNLGLSPAIPSDVASLHRLILPLFTQFPDLHALHDPTRGGLAGALEDIAEGSKVQIRLEEKAIPIQPRVAKACDLLGLDPLQVANEGKAVLVCPQNTGANLLAALRKLPGGEHAAIIGEVTAPGQTPVVMRTRFGGMRNVSRPSGNFLPRIC